MSYIVVAYFTAGTLYEIEVKRLIASLMRFSIPYFVKSIEDKGNWYLNTQYKPEFLLEMLDKFPGKSIIYVDADAEFLQNPVLFETLHNRPDVNIGVHLLDHKKRGRNANFEMLSGTIYLKNNNYVRNLLIKWKDICVQGGKVWDQSALSQVLQGVPFQVLPEEYCVIFDYMSDVSSVVIKHFQASRKVSNKISTLPLLNKGGNFNNKQVNKSTVVPKPRKVGRGGLIRYRRPGRN